MRDKHMIYVIQNITFQVVLLHYIDAHLLEMRVYAGPTLNHHWINVSCLLGTQYMLDL